MKNIKFAMLLAFVLLFSIAGSGCQQTYDYSFTQSIDHVEKVEIHQYNYDTKTSISLVTLSNDHTHSLLNDLNQLKCRRHFGDHTQDYGEVIIYITYTDGTAEVIGLWNIATVDKNGAWHIGIEYFDAKELCTIILKYVDQDLLPDLSQYQ